MRAFLTSFVLMLAAAATLAEGVPYSEFVRRQMDDSGTIRERARFYLFSHGDSGRIDPELRLRRVRAEYERRTTVSHRPQPDAVGGTTFLSIGPANGAGRMTAIALSPSSSSTIFGGAAGGGLWKSVNGGGTWAPLTDDLNDLSVGAVAVAPSDANRIYVGTGEGGIATDFIPGIGLIESTDGGAHWILPASVVATQFYRISVHPQNPDELVAGTNAGGLRSTDGGAHWAVVIDPSIYSDVTDLVRDPSDPAVLFASTWDEQHWCAAYGNCTIRSPRILKSTDSGAHWNEAVSGFPISTKDLEVDRISLAATPSNSAVLYAAFPTESSAGGEPASHIYRSSNGGASWGELSSLSGDSDFLVGHYLATQGWYDNAIAVSPIDGNTIVAGGVYYVRSTDGGITWAYWNSEFGEVGNVNVVHTDCHDLRFAGATLWIANDGGIYSSPDAGNSAVNLNATLVTRQFYDLALDPTDHSRMLAGSQDNGTSRRPDTGGSSWDDVLGADGFSCAFSPLVPSIGYATTEGGNVFRTKEAGTAFVPGIRPNFFFMPPPYPRDGTELTPFRSTMVVDPAVPGRIYTTTHRVWQSLDAGENWRALPTIMADGSPFPYSSIASLSICRADDQVFVIAKNFGDPSSGTASEGSVLWSADGGSTWDNRSTGLSGKYVMRAEVDPSNPKIAYAALASTDGDSVFRTTDGGAHWVSRSTGLPEFAAGVLRIDPTDSNTIYAGTDVGLYRSTDQGATWGRFGSGLPSSSIQDMQILPDGSILRVATHGRGVWELSVPALPNHAPVVSITTPASDETLSPGTSVSFKGTASDPDPGDTADLVWTFPDTWESVRAHSGATVLHTFFRAGVVPVTLSATDLHGAETVRTVVISVPEAFHTCAAPFVIPPQPTGPWAVEYNNEATVEEDSNPVPACSTVVGAKNWYGEAHWFEFTPAQSGTYEFSTCAGSGADTVLSLWTGPRCGPYAAVTGGCNDNAPSGSPCSGLIFSDLSVALSAGQTVRLMAATYEYPAGRGRNTLVVRNLAAPATSPVVTGAVPFVASPSGGTRIYVYGSGFTAQSRVSIGGASAAAFQFLDSSTLSVFAPPGAPGTADVVVSNPGVGAGTLARGITYGVATVASPVTAVSPLPPSKTGRRP